MALSIEDRSLDVLEVRLRLVELGYGAYIQI